jgi:hypothetical protein
MSFTVTLNSIVLNDEPMGLNDGTSIDIVRDADIQGLFTILVSELTFWGDGYKVIVDAINTIGVCSTIDVRILENCSDNPIDFNGIIYLSDVEIDKYKCTASCAVEDNSLASQVMRLKETKVRINSNRTLNGSLLASIGTTLNAGGSVGNKTWYRFRDLMEHVLDYITDNGISVVSTFMNTNYQESEYTWTCISTGASAGIIISFRDFVGIQRTTVFTIPPGLTDDQYAERIAQGMLGFNPSYPIFDGGGPISATVSGNVITLKFAGNISNLTFSLVGTGTVTPVIVKGSTYGLNNVFITSGENIQGGFGGTFVSFLDLVSIGGYYNLSFEFVKNGSIQEIRVEQEPAFFNLTQNAVITDAKIIESQIATTVFSSLTYSEQNEDNTLTYYKAASYVSYSCAQNSISLSASVGVPTGILPNNASSSNSDRLYICESVPSTSNIAAYQSTYFSGGTIVNGGIYYALSIANLYAAKNYVNRAPFGLTYEGNTIPNNNNVKIAKGISFEAPLTRAQFESILANRKGYINVNGINGWISSVSYNIKSGMTNFDLLIE